MQTLIHTALATDATQYFGIGFVPDYVKAINLVDRLQIEWWRRPAVGAPNGIATDADGTKTLLTTAATGIVAYAGTGILPSQSTSILTPDTLDRKTNVTRFTLTNSTNKTGNFDVAADTTYVGVGSMVMLGRTLVKILAITGTGEGADAVTIDEVPVFDRTDSDNPIYDVSYISNKNTLYFARADEAVPEGFVLGADAAVNTDATDTLLIEATRL